MTNSIPCMRRARTIARTVIAAILYHIFNRVTQIFRQTIINSQLSCIYNAHIHACFNRMIKKNRMDRFTHHIITTEGKGDITDSTRNHNVR